MVIKMLTELRKRMDEHRENFSDDIENRRSSKHSHRTEENNN